jgi:glycosyltransferase involved in cell wall biosynthesis
MFSVVIPIYNKSEYIEKCLQSVLNQSCQDFELIIVNDGSTDESLLYINNVIKRKYREDCEKKSKFRKKETCTNEFQQNDKEKKINEPQCSHYNEYPKIKIISQANMGVSVARNVGVKAAKYKYIAFLDADDWWNFTFLENMKELIEKYPDAGLYGCNYFIVKNRIKQINFTRSP